MRRPIHFLLVATLLVATVPSAWAIQYHLTRLGSLCGTPLAGAESPSSRARGINNPGQVVGFCTCPSGETQAFIWQDGIMSGLGNLGVPPSGAAQSIASSINDLGRVVGYSSSSTGNQAFVWQDGIMTPLGHLGASSSGELYSSAAGINNAGRIVGVSSAPGGGQAFIWENGTMTGLGYLPGKDCGSWATAVSGDGIVVGSAGCNGDDEAFIASGPGTMTGLGFPPGFYNSEATAISANGSYIAGWGYSVYGIEAFIRDDQGMHGLGDFPGGMFSSTAFGVNDAGQVVGNGYTTYGGTQPADAMTWDPQHGMRNLNDLLDASGAGWHLFSAYAINNAGQIAGAGLNPQGGIEAFLLNPEASPPFLEYSPGEFTFEAIVDLLEPKNQELSIWNSGDGTMNWSVSSDARWVISWPDEGTGRGTVSINVQSGPFEAGIYRANVTITAPAAANSPRTVPITLIVYPRVALLQPNGGDTLANGQHYLITWEAPPLASAYRLRYTLDYGGTWVLIADGITGSSYDWTVPLLRENFRNRCLVEIATYNASGALSDAAHSENYFSINVVDILSPDGGEVLRTHAKCEVGLTIHQTAAPIAREEFYFTLDGGNTWSLIKSFKSPVTTLTWNVPLVKKAASQCLVKVVLKDAAGNSLGSDTSRSFFTITP